MKLQRTTWVLVTLAFILGGFVYFYEIQGTPQREANQAKKKQLFNFKKEDIISLKIKKKEQNLEFIKTDKQPHPWEMKQPEVISASDASVSFLLDLLVNSKSDRSFSITNEQKQQYGLDQPLAKINIQLKNQDSHELILGKPNFDNKFIYAQSDQELTVFLIPIDFQYAVDRDLKEWKQKPIEKKSSNSQKKPTKKTESEE